MEYNLQAATREIKGKKVKVLRRQGLIPAAVYGKGEKNMDISLDGKTFNKLYGEAGTSTLVNLVIDQDKPIKVLVREPQLDPINLKPAHVDFYKVNMKEKIRTEVPLEMIGDSPVVIDLEGKLVTSLDAIEVECLPEDLVQHIEVDVSILTEFDQAIHVSDLKVPEKIEVLTDPELVVVVAQAPISEEELEAELAEPVSDEEAEAVAELGAEPEQPAEGEEEVADSREQVAGENTESKE